MARRSPAVDRAVAVLNHLAAAPRQRFTLSELARDLDLNKATAHALLATLVDVGYLVRHDDDKSYALGPALIALGNAALQSYPAATLAQEPMDRLAQELDLSVVASAGIGSEIVILASAGTPRPLGINVQPGLRMPLVPPLGTVFVAWSGPARSTPGSTASAPTPATRTSTATAGPWRSCATAATRSAWAGTSSSAWSSR